MTSRISIREWKNENKPRASARDNKDLFCSFNFFASETLLRRSREFAGGLFWPVNSLITTNNSLTMSQNCGRRRKRSKLSTKRLDNCKSTTTPWDSHCSRPASFRHHSETPIATFFVFSAREQIRLPSRATFERWLSVICDYSCPQAKLIKIDSRNPLSTLRFVLYSYITEQRRASHIVTQRVCLRSAVWAFCVEMHIRYRFNINLTPQSNIFQCSQYFMAQGRSDLDKKHSSGSCLCKKLSFLLIKRSLVCVQSMQFNLKAIF